MDWVVLFPDPHAACCVEGHYVVVHLNATPVCNLQRKKMTLNNLLQVVPWPLGLVSWGGMLLGLWLVKSLVMGVHKSVLVSRNMCSW